MGDLRRLAAWAMAGACFLAVAPRAGAAVAFGQLDDFRDGTTMGWIQGLGSSNPPTNVGTGGPAGAADRFLKFTSNGVFGPGSKLVAFNQSQWSGDFATAGVTRIDAQLANFGATDLFMRLAVRGGTGTSFGSTAAVTLPAGSGWRSVTFNLGAASMTLLGGPDALDAVLANVTEFRLLSAQAAPSFMGDAVAAALGVDGVRALRLPGDANFDGTVGFPDLVTVAQHYDAAGATWADGDFNFDGLVGFPDLVTVAQNYDSRGPAAAVPEPSGIISGLAAFLLVAGRRRRRVFSRDGASPPSHSVRNPAILPPMKLADLAVQLNAELVGDGDIEVHSLASLEDAGAGQLSFLSNAKYQKEFEATRAAAVIVGLDVRSDRVPLLRSKDAYYAFAQAMVLLHGHRRHPHPGIHPGAHVDPTAEIGPGTVIYPGAFVGPRARVGRDCVLYPNAVIYEECVLGDRVAIHAGTVIGVDGFGYATHAGVHHKIPQVGRVTIGDDVEIGANCTIARGALSDTVIGAGTKIDGLVMIGHGTTVGPGCLIVAQVGIAGSVTLGKYVVMGGQAAATGHLTIGDGAVLAARAAATNDIPARAVVIGAPALPIAQGRRVHVALTRLPELIERVRRLERSQAASQESDGNPKPEKD